MKHFNDIKTFTEYSNNMDNIDEYNARKKRKRLIVFDDMIADMLSNNIRNSIVTELFIRGRKPNTSLNFITQSYVKLQKYVRLNTTHIFITKISSKRELSIAFNYSSYIHFKDMNLYKKCTVKSYGCYSCIR